MFEVESNLNLTARIRTKLLFRLFIVRNAYLIQTVSISDSKFVRSAQSFCNVFIFSFCETSIN